MTMQTRDKLRHAIVERRIQKVRQSSSDLDVILDKLTAMTNVQNWMIPGLVAAAAVEWEKRERDWAAYVASFDDPPRELDECFTQVPD